MKKRKSRPENQRPDGRYSGPMSITWSEKYDERLSTFWNALPESISKILVTTAMFLLGISINGDWIPLWFHASRQWGIHQIDYAASNRSFRWNEFSLEYFRLQDLWSFWWTSCLVSFTIYFTVGGFIHWYYYVKQRDKPEDWKCQPQKWLSPELEKNEILWGTSTLFVNASFSSLVACYIANGGYSTVYYTFNEYGWIWLILQLPLVFIYQDYLTYWMHRIYHTPFLYKKFHKLHHRYKQPTVFSVTAIHPIECLNFQLCLVSPIFLVPCHWLLFYTSVLYAYYHGMLDHSGVNFKSFWWQPWQPDAIFHDNHHQYFHVNFAFNIIYWDKLHGTYRRKDRIYNEDIYYGIGKSVESASEEELLADIEERELENPLAYRADMPFKFSQQEKKELGKKF